MTDRLAVGLATGGGISYIPTWLLGRLGVKTARGWTGAGLLGTAEGLAVLPWVPEAPWGLASFLAVSAGLSAWVCGRAEKALGRHDDPRIVLDEIVGFWTAVAFLPRAPRLLAAGFLLFRVYDALKPPPCRALERLPGGWGVVADDLGAGVLANLSLRLAACAWPALLA